MKKRRAPIKMRKGIYILPNLFTTGNLFCGFYAIISVFQEKFEYAAYAIILASVFDVLDGIVARLRELPRNSESSTIPWRTWFPSALPLPCSLSVGP
jgi:hypothetical protein